MSPTWDVVVVGAGPAGSLAATLLARRGLRVLIVDQAAFPRYKVCGCCLNPYTTHLLANAGLRATLADAAPISRMCLTVPGRRAEITLAGWRVLSRERLDQSLVTAAIEAGATFLPRHTALLGNNSSAGRALTIGDTAVTARLVLAADGLGGHLLQSETRPMQPARRQASRVGAGAVADSAPQFFQPGIIYMAYGPGGYAGFVRREDGKLNLAAALSLDAVRSAHGPAEVVAQLVRDVGWPALNVADLTWRGTPPLTWQPAQPGSERCIAIGDACGYVEPFTGEGIGWALESAEAVVPFALRAVTDWQPCLLREWSAIQAKVASRRRRLCRAVTWVSHRPRLTRLIVGIVGAVPSLARPVVRRIGVPACDPLRTA